MKNNDQEAMERLQRMVGPFILRRLKQDVLRGPAGKDGGGPVCTDDRKAEEAVRRPGHPSEIPPGPSE
ncbi:MAG: hypothetical protein ACLU8D_11240 [Enterocloster sp.]